MSHADTRKLSQISIVMPPKNLIQYVI